MLNSKIEFSIERRPAIVTLSKLWAGKLGVEAGEHTCEVSGPFQYIESSECAYPVYVCELKDGHVFYTATSDVQIMHTEEEDSWCL